MKKILLSLAVIAIVAVGAIGATRSFFSDTETSTGNTFTAGAIDLTVDSTQHYNGNVCTSVPVLSSSSPASYKWIGTAPYPVPGTACDGTWAATDLGAQKFFNFTDIKPGDSGENTISLHINNNDAWACVDVNVTKNSDVTSTEPELASPDVLATPGSLTDGELAQNVYFTAWADDGDNIWEANEPLLFTNKSGPASDVLGGKTYALADSTTGGVPLTGAVTKNIGLAWCAGTQTVTESTHTIACNGATMGNNTQTDSMEASIAFRVEQSRNNANFRCSDVTNGGEELKGSLAAQDFGVVDYSTGTPGQLKGYSAGFGVAGNTFAGATSVVVKLYSAGDVLMQTNTAILPKFNTDITGTQFSSPFDVNATGGFDYAADGYWTNVRAGEYGQNVAAAKVVATVTLANGKVVTATNTNLTGDSFLPGVMSAQDFGVMNFSNVIGYSAGFAVDTTFTGAQSIVVKLYSGTNLLQTDTATALLKGTSSLTQISSPFNVSGTFNYATDGYWTNVRDVTDWGQLSTPTKVIATVVLGNGKVVTATNLLP